MADVLSFKWTVSRARDTYGYNICTLRVNGKVVSRCNGGNYDMPGTCLGHFFDTAYAERILKLSSPFYGLTYHDPNYDPGKAVIDNETVEDREQKGESFGLERYQAFYRASTELPDDTHTVPEIRWGIGIDSVRQIGEAIGLKLEFIHSTRNETIYRLVDSENASSS